MNSLTRQIITLEDFQNEAMAFITALPAETNSATLVTLSGELGAGKTTFTQYVAQELGIADVVNSPTFVIEKIYGIPPDEDVRADKIGVDENGMGSPRNRFSRLVHIDAYRLQGSGDLTALGFGEVMSHTGTLILLEWPENVTGVIEEAAVRILLEILPDGSRQITYA